MTQAIMACPSCAAQVSPKALDCPSCGHPLKKLRRGPIGFVFKWLFILFNLFMLAWVVLGVGAASESIGTAQSDAERAGAAIGTTLGFGMILALWVMGDIILGLLVMFTRPKR